MEYFDDSSKTVAGSVKKNKTRKDRKSGWHRVEFLCDETDFRRLERMLEKYRNKYASKDFYKNISMRNVLSLILRDIDNEEWFNMACSDRPDFMQSFKSTVDAGLKTICDNQRAINKNLIEQYNELFNLMVKSANTIILDNHFPLYDCEESEYMLGSKYHLTKLIADKNFKLDDRIFSIPKGKVLYSENFPENIANQAKQYYQSIKNIVTDDPEYEDENDSQN